MKTQCIWLSRESTRVALSLALVFWKEQENQNLAPHVYNKETHVNMMEAQKSDG